MGDVFLVEGAAVRSVIRTAFVVALLLSATACVNQPSRAVNESDRMQPQGRELVVTVTQGEIKADFQPATAGQAFGIIGALIDVGVNQSRARTAEQTVQPLRDALVGYDFDRFAEATVEATMKDVPWLGINNTSFFKDMSNERLNGSLDASTTPEVVFTDAAYALKPDYSAVGVDWTVSILKKQPPPGESKSDRLKLKNFVFNRAFLCVAPAAETQSNPASYVEEWSANQAQPLKNAVFRCMSALRGVVRRSLNATPTEVEAQKKVLDGQTGELVDGNYGKVIERTPADTLLVDQFQRWIIVLPPPAAR